MSIKFFGQAAATAAAALRFFRRASKPIMPRPPAKSGSAAGNGVAMIGPLANIGYRETIEGQVDGRKRTVRSC